MHASWNPDRDDWSLKEEGGTATDAVRIKLSATDRGLKMMVELDKDVCVGR